MALILRPGSAAGVPDSSTSANGSDLPNGARSMTSRPRRPPLHRIAAFLFFMAGGLGFFLLLLNRVLIHLESGGIKETLIIVLFTITVVASALLGTRCHRRKWLLIPTTFLLLVILDELHSVHRRQIHSASPPVEERGIHPSIFEPVTTTDLRILRYEVPLDDWHGPPFRIVQISDLHLHSRLPLSYYEACMKSARMLKPDIVVHTGDYGIREVRDEGLIRILRMAGGRLGTFGILGNHDRKYMSRPLHDALRRGGVELVGNRSRRVEIAAGHAIVLSGCESPWSKPLWQPPALEKDELLVVLSHTPDNVFRLARKGARIVLAGHYHGGQIRVPWLGALVIPSAFGRSFDRGHFLVDGCHLFVSAGVGVSTIRLRLCCPPDIVAIDVLPAQGRPQ